MNSSEYAALDKAISNDARVLYMLGLRPTADAVTGVTAPLDYKQLLSLLNAKDKKFSRGRQLNSLIKELVNVGLIHLPDELDLSHSLNSQRLTLIHRPKVKEPSHLLPNKYSMLRDWQPSTRLYNDICALIGIIDTQYSDDELGEYIAYWLGRPEAQWSEYQWNQKFAQHIKRNRTANDAVPLKQIGTQTVSQSVSSLEADDNAKRLVAKYKQSRNKN